NNIIEVEKKQLLEIPVPFLAHCKSNGGEFVLVKNKDNLENQIPNFFERWTGLVLIANKPSNWKHAGNEESLKKEKKQKVNYGIIFGGLMTAIISPVVYSFTIQQALLILIAVTGLLVSILIMSKQLGIENKMVNQICGKGQGCGVIMNSQSNKLPFGITWSDLGIIWFAFFLLTLMISSYTSNRKDIYGLLFLFAMASLPFTLFSVYFQFRIKNWCRLCLIIVGLLWAQFGVLFSASRTLFEKSLGLSIPLLLLTLFIGFTVTTLWLWVKKIIQENKILKYENLLSKGFKNNIDLFIALLRSQRHLNVESFEDELQLGKTNAHLQITVVCNPYCKPCANAHEELSGLCEKNNMGLIIRFAIDAKDKQAKDTKAVEYILQYVKDLQSEAPSFMRKVLFDWYQWMDLEKFSNVYKPLKSNNVNRLMNMHSEWTRKNVIRFTPTIFVNGFQLPQGYTMKELQLLIPRIISYGTIVPENKNQFASMDI
ncbi:MAG TPA: vitamin K epoxide reductase family protein, partial [Cytophaga sp.]|nr:vitamin K epoxide reductase family protein [Cytophaga sp.]